MTGSFNSGVHMVNPKKAPGGPRDVSGLVGETVLVRSALWQNGKRHVAAIVSEASADPALLVADTIATVSLTAFPPGAPSRMMRDVSLFSAEPEESIVPAAWIRRKAQRV